MSLVDNGQSHTAYLMTKLPTRYQETPMLDSYRTKLGTVVCPRV